jgi:tRNA dimethylallyltransferase
MTDQELYDLLREVDPDAADQISHHNRRRVMRAIEVARRGDRPISRRQHAWSDYNSPYELSATGLEMDREVLYARIDARVDRMIDDGLVDEVKSLRENGLEHGTTAGEALGYRQVLDALDGLLTVEQAVAEIKKRTRHYAKRQLTWFGKDPRIKWFKVHASPHDPPAKVDETLADTAALVLEYLASTIE